MKNEATQISIQALKGMCGGLAGTAAAMKALADRFAEPDEETRLLLNAHAAELADVLDKTADALVIAWHETQRASNAAWAQTPAAKTEGAEHGL